MRVFRTGVALLLLLALGACVSGGQKQVGGTLLGGAAGAVAGAQFGKGRGQLAATALGTLLGAMVGNEVGRSLDRADRFYAAEAEQDALEYGALGTTTSWRNPDSGHYGEVVPVETYRTPQGIYCREYSHTIYVGGRAQEGYGRACRQPDGSWQIVG